MRVPGRLCGRRFCVVRAGLWALDLSATAGGFPARDLIGEPALPNRAGDTSRTSRRANSSAASASTGAQSPSVRRASMNDAASLATTMNIPVGRVLSRLALERRCYIAELSGQIASYGWLSFGQEDIPELESTLYPDPGEAYIWDCYTLPAYRGLGLMPVILRQMTSELAQLGAGRAWAVILANNHPSEAAFRKAGFVDAARLTYVRLLALRHIFLSKGPFPAPRLRLAASS